MIVYIVQVILLAALVAAAVRRKKAPGAMTPVVVGLAVLILALQGVTMVRGCRAKLWAAESTDFFEAAGYRLGQAIPSHVAESGPVLVIHGGGDFEGARRARASYLGGLRAGLGNGGFEVVEGDPSLMGTGEMMDLEQSLSLAVLPRYREQHPDAVAMVSMVGVPVLAPGTRAPQPDDLPPLFILGTPRSRAADPLFRAGLLKAAVFFKGSYNSGENATRKMPMEELFDLRFELVEGPA